MEIERLIITIPAIAISSFYIVFISINLPKFKPSTNKYLERIFIPLIAVMMIPFWNYLIFGKWLLTTFSNKMVSIFFCFLYYLLIIQFVRKPIHAK